MARAGIQVTGEGGNLQIDDTFFNYRLVSQGAKSLAAFSFNDNAIPAGNTVSYSGINPIIMFKTSSIYVAIASKEVSGSTHTWTLASDAAGICNYVIFDTAPPVGGNSGLQLFNESGTLVFDSSSQLLRISGVVSGASATMPAGRTYASSLNHTLLGFADYTGPGGVEWTELVGSSINVSGNVISRDAETLQIIPEFSGNFASQDQFYSDATTTALRFVVADITGY